MTKGKIYVCGEISRLCLIPAFGDSTPTLACFQDGKEKLLKWIFTMSSHIYSGIFFSLLFISSSRWKMPGLPISSISLYPENPTLFSPLIPKIYWHGKSHSFRLSFGFLPHISDWVTNTNGENFRRSEIIGPFQKHSREICQEVNLIRKYRKSYCVPRIQLEFRSSFL